MTTTTKAVLAGHVAAMLDRFDPGSTAGSKLGDWLRWNSAAIGIDFAAVTSPPVRGRKRRTPPAAGRPLPRASWRRLRSAIARAAADGAGETDAVATNLDAFATALGLAPLDTAIFRLVFLTRCERGFGALCDDLVASRILDSVGIVALALRCDTAAVWQRLNGGALALLHLVEIAGNARQEITLSVPYRVAEALTPPRDGLADIERHLIGAPLTANLDCGDYDHVARQRDFVIRLLRGAVAERRRGVNILVHGAPGTGKSEFCKLVARQAGCDLFAVGEADEFGDEPSRSDRIDALRLADRLAGRRGNAALLFDEMEDVLQHGERASGGGSIRRAGSKVFFNRLLEQGGAPVLWTANAVDEFDPAFLRRMTFAFEMKPLAVATRARLWRGLARQHQFDLSPERAAALARRHRVAPSLMAAASDAVALAGGDAEELDFAVTVLAQPIGGTARPEAKRPGAGFSTALLNADIDLESLTRQLAAPHPRADISFCLHGPPGAGKSAYARHLAEAMDMDPLVKRGSDLLSKWVGGTEQRIAAAFEEARQDDRFLIIDEVEAFLWDRGDASRSWEVSMVDELLTAIEAHPLPFAVTTNHLHRLDPAALRRFSFKVGFDFLTSVQAAEAYRRFFDRAPPVELAQLTTLTPADFATVAKQLRVIGGEAVADRTILRRLEREILVKRLPARKIGF